MNRTAVTAFVRNIQALAIVSLWGACGNGFAQMQFITPCQVLLTVVNEEATRSTKIEAFELKISKTEDDKLIAQVQGETQIEFFYATQPSVLKQQKIKGMAVNIEKTIGISNTNTAHHQEPHGFTFHSIQFRVLSDTAK